MEGYYNETDYVQLIFKNVTNTKEIRQKIFSTHLPICLIKPKYIADPFQLTAALTKASYNLKEKTMITRSLQTELLYFLSPSKNISESLVKFGASDDDTEFIFIGDEASYSEIKPIINGDEALLDTIKNFTNEEEIKKMYKITEEELLASNLLDSIVSRISTKEYAHA